MAQTSGPISQGTTAERQFTDVQWRDLFGDEPGVLADLNGTSYALTLPTTTDIVSVGSASQVSIARVAGFVHRIPAASTEPITIPAASGSARTDIIALRYDPAYTGAPGPVRLFRVAGSGTALPTYDSSSPGVEDLPLWSIQRSPGQTLAQATVKRMFPRLAPSLEVATGSPLPLSSPIGTIVRQGTATFRRALDSSQVPTWVSISAEYQGGEVTATTNATGGVQVNHTLGRVPTAVTVNATRDSGTGFFCIVYAKTSTTFSVRVYSGGGTYSNSSISFNWMAL